MPESKHPDDVVDVDEGTRIDESLLSAREVRPSQPVVLDGDPEATRFVVPSPSPAEEGAERTVLIESPFASAAAAPAPPPPPKAVIRIETGPDEGRSWPLVGEGPFLVGRSLECAVVLNDPTASRKHFEVRFTDGTWRLRDLGSGNGTLVDGIRVSQECDLRPGTLIEAGRTRVQFHCDPVPGDLVAVAPDEEKTRVVESLEEFPLPGPTLPGKGQDRGTGAVPSGHGPRTPSEPAPRAMEPPREPGGGFPYLAIVGGLLGALLLAVGIAQFGFGVRILPIGEPKGPSPEELQRQQEARQAEAVRDFEQRLREAFQERQWDRAIALAQRARSEGLPVPDLDQSLAQAKAEKRHKSLVDDAREALEQQSFPQARDLASQVPDTSVHYPEAREVLAALDRQGLAQRIEETRLLLRQGRKADARKAFLALLKDHPEDGEVMALRQEFIQAGIPLDPPPPASPAIGDGAAAPVDRPAPVKGAKEKALALYRQQKFQEAVDLLRRGSRRDSAGEEEELADQIERFAALLTEGREAVRTKRLDRAESALQQVLRLDQGLGGAFTEEIRSLLGDTYRGRAAAAIADADYVVGSRSSQRALKYNPSDKVAQDILDKCLVHAQQEYEKAVQESRAGKTQEARARAQRVLDIVPKGHPLEEKAAGLLR